MSLLRGDANRSPGNLDHANVCHSHRRAAHGRCRAADVCLDRRCNRGQVQPRPGAQFAAGRKEYDGNCGLALTGIKAWMRATTRKRQSRRTSCRSNDLVACLFLDEYSVSRAHSGSAESGSERPRQTTHRVGEAARPRSCPAAFNHCSRRERSALARGDPARLPHGPVLRHPHDASVASDPWRSLRAFTVDKGFEFGAPGVAAVSAPGTLPPVS